MRFGPIEVKDKLGRTIILRNAEMADAENLINYMKTTTAETPFLIREPDEFCLTLEQEEAFINGCIGQERELMLIATIDGEHIGNCSLMRVGTYRRYQHRCEIAIALYQKYCGFGIGKAMMETVLSVAGELGYEQAELEVIRNNANAVNLYKKLGFNEYGTFPDNMKYAAGTYAEAVWMMKKL
ncbi:MAG: GNAT family N-acetyltransferase [Acetatifactor sp.]|nr:GNAT family N-acetyltransferase [Acetatifactor sp.]